MSPLVLSSSCILPILHSMLWRQDRNDLIASKQPIKVSLNKRNNVISWIEADPLTQIDRFVILKMFISWRDLRAKPIGKKTSRIVLLGLMAESAWKDNKFSSQKFTRIVGQSDKHTARNSWDRGDHGARAKGSERGRAGAHGALGVRPVHWCRILSWLATLLVTRLVTLLATGMATNLKWSWSDHQQKQRMSLKVAEFSLQNWLGKLKKF